MSAVSILHAPRDEALSEKIAAALARAGHAAKRISADPMVGDLSNEPDDAGTAIVVWTEAAAKLARLHEQAREAMARGALIPVAVGRVRPPGGFESLPPVDLSGWSGALDDPRWRFVLDEIELTRQRAQVEDGAVWPDEAPSTEAVADETPPETLPEEETERLALYPSTDEWPDDSALIDRRLPQTRPRPMAARGPRRRFKSRDVAIGATFGIVAMTLLTAILAPVVLPQLGGPTTPQTVDSFPNPSVNESSSVSSLQLSDKTSEPVGAVESDAGDISSSAAPLRDMPIAIALRDDETALADAPANADVEAQTTAPASEDAVAALEETGVEEAGTEAPETDAAESGAAPAEPALKPQKTAAIDAPAGPDSDAMGNLVASVAAEAAGAATPGTGIDPLPEELRETAYLGNYFKECVACPDMAALPGGSFRMGAPLDESGSHPSESPAHVVTIDHRFAIATREVTFDQWDACVADGGCRAYEPPDQGWGRGKRPVVGVSHEDAQAFTAWLSNKTGRNYRLPTEAEWEFAARGGAASPFAYGDRISSDRANYNGNYPYLNEKSAFRGRTTPVASFQPNAFGLFDMHGNAWEWTSDCWSDSHEGAPADGAARAAGDCSRRVLKGGAWNTGAWRLRSAHRIGKPANTREYDNGFRVARDLD